MADNFGSIIALKSGTVGMDKLQICHTHRGVHVLFQPTITVVCFNTHNTIR